MIVVAQHIYWYSACSGTVYAYAAQHDEQDSCFCRCEAGHSDGLRESSICSSDGT